MRHLLVTALLVILFLRNCDTKHLYGFQIVYQQIEKGMGCAGVTLSIVRVNASTVLKLSKANKGDDFAFEHFASGKHKMTATEAHSKKDSSPAELTLEYMAVQLLRTHASQ